ncbi:Uncharacterised protein [Yersinia similis]|uniref:Uncharacterized protein n=1 Tax=Yersinia similis TaxID=367190 RepID=A0A0T9P4J2_9GAMM|nr:hypothetical protein [Yersinia similis]CNH45449.1 Uncharacterised protein [Yersinia similis]
MLSKDNDWNIDTSAGVPILVYKNCSVIESEQAEYILQLINNEVEIAAELLSLREQLACRDAMLFTAAKQIALGTEDVNSKVDITCHSCRRFITHQQHADADGFCPYCDVWMIRVQK